MALTYVAIATTTVGSGGTTEIEFTNIPQTYTDLLVYLSIRTEDTGAYNGATKMTFNNNSNAVYSFRRLLGNGSAASSSSGSSQTFIRVSNNAPTTSDTASTFSNSMLYIPNYTGTTAKSTSEDNVSESNTTTAYAQLVAGLWNPATQAAITSIKFTRETLNISQYSTATLYGIKNS